MALNHLGLCAVPGPARRAQEQHVRRARQRRPGEWPWLTAAIPIENPYCSCKLTRVRRPRPRATNSRSCRTCGRRRARATGSARSRRRPPRRHGRRSTRRRPRTRPRGRRPGGGACCGPKNPFRDTGCCCHPLTAAPCLGSGPPQVVAAHERAAAFRALEPHARGVGWAHGLQLQSLWAVPTAAVS